MSRKHATTTAPNDRALVDRLTDYALDPLGFVQAAFPWGEGALEDEQGPDTWQADVLSALGDSLRGAQETNDAVRFAIASGHGVGKTALSAWLVLWFLSTRDHPQVVVTANTAAQLRNKTWRELAKWHRLAANKHWFAWTSERFAFVENPETWFAAAVAWSKDRPEAFAGTHDKHVLMLFDEASAIADEIWDVTEGAMSTPGALWVALGNPTRNSGRFRECFRRYRHRWTTRTVDSRQARKANGAQLKRWVEDYGEDSDFVRVRVRGVFPRAGNSQSHASTNFAKRADRVLTAVGQDDGADHGGALRALQRILNGPFRPGVRCRLLRRTGAFRRDKRARPLLSFLRIGRHRRAVAFIPLVVLAESSWPPKPNLSKPSAPNIPPWCCSTR